MAVRPAWIQVFLDVPSDRFEEALSFWSAVTGWPPSERRGEDGQFLTLQPREGPAYVKLQAVSGPSGVHLDLDSADRPALVERALALGARPAWTYHDVEVMHSPGGLTFCHTVVDGEPTLARDGATILDQVCLDIPSAHWESEVVRLVEDGRVRLLLQRLREPDGPVRAHPDLATSDRRGDTARHVGLGATLRAEHDHWTVLEAPGGQVYCLTDRDPLTGRAGGV
jgi:hypothetical protein